MTTPTIHVYDEVSGQWVYVASAGGGGDGGGTGGTASRYTHIQSVLAVTWAVNHNLGAHPIVGLEDAGGSTIYGTILHVNSNTLTVTFNRSCTGRANCI